MSERLQIVGPDIPSLVNGALVSTNIEFNLRRIFFCLHLGEQEQMVLECLLTERYLRFASAPDGRLKITRLYSDRKGHVLETSVRSKADLGSMKEKIRTAADVLDRLAAELYTTPPQSQMRSGAAGNRYHRRIHGTDKAPLTVTHMNAARDVSPAATGLRSLEWYASVADDVFALWLGSGDRISYAVRLGEWLDVMRKNWNNGSDQ